jgi:phosphoglycolate phosphatase-like HAD superfamily hydrolase
MEDALGKIAMGGRTDAWIAAQMAKAQGVAFDADVLQRFRAVYLSHLRREIHLPGPQKGVLPGIRAVLETVAPRVDVHLALLTGNFEEGARIKLQYFDLWHFFSSGAFGDEHHDRNALLEVAISRVRDAGGPTVTPSEVLIIGDTPLDVAVAVAGGARSLAVATGTYGEDELRASGADVVLPDLQDLTAALEGMGLTSGPVETPGRRQR